MRKETKLLETPITIYWWNFGKKTLDFQGTLKDYLKRKGIKVTYKKYPLYPEMYTYTFRYDIGGGMVYKYRGNYFGFLGAVKDVICFGLVYMGDKAQVEFDIYKKKINWY